MMKDYVVHNTREPFYKQWLLVKAANKKDAINKAYKAFGEDYNKKDYVAYSLHELYADSDIENIAIID